MLLATPLRLADDMPGDAALIDAVARGDRRVAVALYDRLRTTMSRALRRVAPRSLEHDDLLQQAFVELVVSLRTRPTVRSLDAWAATIAARVVFHRLRRVNLEARFAAVDDDGELLDSMPDSTESAHAVVSQRQLLERKAISPADYDVAINELNTADAEIALVRAQIARTEIRAPFAGVVGLRNVSLGSYIAPTTKIATLSSVNPVKVDFFVPERYSGAVRPGSSVTFTVGGDGDRISGRVYAVEPRLEQSTRTLQVRATAPNPGGRLMPAGAGRLPEDAGRRAAAGREEQ